MNVNEFQILAILFFGVFEAIGGILIGLGVHRLIEQASTGLGSIVLGVVWSAATTLVCYTLLYRVEPKLFYLELIVLGSCTVGRIIVPQEWVDGIGAGTVLAIALGTVVTVIGAGVAIETFRRQEEILFGILFGGCWSFVGITFFATGVRALLRGKPLHLRQKSAGKYMLTEDDEPVPPKPTPKPKQPPRRRKK